MPRIILNSLMVISSPRATILTQTVVAVFVVSALVSVAVVVLVAVLVGWLPVLALWTIDVIAFAFALGMVYRRLLLLEMAIRNRVAF